MLFGDWATSILALEGGVAKPWDRFTKNSLTSSPNHRRFLLWFVKGLGNSVELTTLRTESGFCPKNKAT
jgi:hypothetical protein